MTTAPEARARRPATPAGWVSDVDGPRPTNASLLRPVPPAATPRPIALPGLRRYAVREGDTLTNIANRFGVSVITIWWANRLETVDRLEVGQQLAIPAGNAVMHTVAEGESLASIAERYLTSQEEIVRLNGLTANVVAAGQQLLVPDGPPIPVATPTPTPTPTPKPTPTPTPTAEAVPEGDGTASVCTDCTFSGAFTWPVPGGEISQGYHAGHLAIDIHAPFGTPVIAAAPGKVIFAGWKNNGGGWQVWLSHGSDLITTYNHLSSVSVRPGAWVNAAQRVGRIGATGWATGPHLHFDVWVGFPWKGGHRVNPLGYL